MFFAKIVQIVKIVQEIFTVTNQVKLGWVRLGLMKNHNFKHVFLQKSCKLYKLYKNALKIQIRLGLMKNQSYKFDEVKNYFTEPALSIVKIQKKTA